MAAYLIVYIARMSGKENVISLMKPAKVCDCRLPLVADFLVLILID
jgi:hypothetical protein